MSDSQQCHVEYRRPGGRQPGDRIVRCQLAKWHEGDHEEIDSASTWPPSISDLVGMDPNFTGGLSTEEYLVSQWCKRYEQCKEIEADREDWKRDCDEREKKRIGVLKLCARPPLSIGGIDYIAVSDVRAILEGPVTS